MSRHSQFKGELKTYSLRERSSKVGIEDFARPLSRDSVTDLIESFPDLLAAHDIRYLGQKLREAKKLSKPIIWGFGGHVVKVGLGPVLVDLMERGFVTGLATNGSGIIHDFEIAVCGNTSEDVDRELLGGGFGMARETGQLLNQAIIAGSDRGQGIGEAVGELLGQVKTQFPEKSIVRQAYERDIPVTVHVAVGTDTIHMHPEACGEAIGRGSLIDFKIFTHQVSRMGNGGAYLNLGSAVILPEVFLKAVSAVRNSGVPLDSITTANFDFIQHYRPQQNVVRRPVKESGCGISITGHHEIMIPLLAAVLIFDTLD
jgi:hypothetical protein